MTLVSFQRALADLTASPSLCREMRRSPENLRNIYELSDREFGRLYSVLMSKGMEANCMIYRANRLAPIALNLPDLCDALRDDLNKYVSEYWEMEPTTDVHFLVEADRFCNYLWNNPAVSFEVEQVLKREHDILKKKLSISRQNARSPTVRAVRPLP
jgi:hypothetical protein